MQLSLHVDMRVSSTLQGQQCVVAIEREDDVLIEEAGGSFRWSGPWRPPTPPLSALLSTCGNWLET